MQREEAREEGRAEGRAETLYSVLVDVLEMKGGLSEKLSEIIKKVHDPEILNRWLLLAMSTDTIKEFEEAVLQVK